MRVETLESGRAATLVSRTAPDPVQGSWNPQLVQHQAKAIGVTGWRRRRASHGHGERQDLVLRRACLVRGIGNGWMVALFLFPTKALAQDQLASPRRAVEACSCKRRALPSTETLQMRRTTIAQSPPTFIITNPDMLHYTLLPGASQRWRRLFDDLGMWSWMNLCMSEAFGAHAAASVAASPSKISAVLSIFCVFRYGARRAGHASAPYRPRRELGSSTTTLRRGPEAGRRLEPAPQEREEIQEEESRGRNDEYDSRVRKNTTRTKPAGRGE